MKLLATFSFLAATVTLVASQSIVDLAAADGKYGTLLNAVTNTPGVLDTITANFPISKWRRRRLEQPVYGLCFEERIVLTSSRSFISFCAAIFGPTDTAFGDISEIVAGLDQSALATVSLTGESHIF